jgi:phosphoribosylaminoimidazole-succinocarboxamide synthase
LRPRRAAAARRFATQARDAAIALYSTAAEHAAACGIIIADTKFEFGLDAAGTLHLIDEALTPDSSRFWPANDWHGKAATPRPMTSSTCATILKPWSGTSRHPVRACRRTCSPRTRAKYVEACERLTGKTFVE